jgi:hypothetical protein
MSRRLLVLVVVVGCSKEKGSSAPPPPPPVGSDAAQVAPPVPVDSAPPDTSPPDAASAGVGDLDDGITYTDPKGGAPGTVEANTVYRSDCTTTHPIARDVCSGTAIPDRGLKSCKSMHVKVFKPCKKGAASCYVERTCPDGRVVPSDFLECAAKQNQGCFTRSSKIYKEGIAYLSDDELAALASQIEQLKVARYRYKDTPDQRLGFVIEDAPDAPWVSSDKRRVDLYALLASSIATLQRQEARIRQLEHDIQACKP